MRFRTALLSSTLVLALATACTGGNAGAAGHSCIHSAIFSRGILLVAGGSSRAD
jgi:hypothetical protein